VVNGFPVRPDPDQRRTNSIDIRLAGTGFTVSRVLSELGSTVHLASYVADDELGRLAAAELRAHGLLGSGILRCASQARALVLHDGSGNRAGVSDLRALPSMRYPTEVYESIVEEVRPAMVVLTNISFTRPLVEATVDRGVPIATDLHTVRSVASPHNRAWMENAQLIACSHEQLPCSPAVWIAELWRTYRTDVVLVGCGPAGAMIGVRRDRSIWRVDPQTPRGVRYTAGAGDTLMGAMVHHYVDSGNAVDAARHAVRTAGWCVGLPVKEMNHWRRADLDTIGALPNVRRI
jgi:sugar/nucleoside kinase (ribokinase family)